VIFALVGCAEASHLCGSIVLHSWQHGKASVEQGYAGEGGICVICAASQQAASSIASSQWMPAFDVSGPLPFRDFSTPHSAEEIALYSRPPPAQ
jgi:hypothetical protein